MGIGPVGTSKIASVFIPAAPSPDMGIGTHRIISLESLGGPAGNISVGTPFPYIAVHIIKSPGIGGKCFDRCRAGEGIPAPRKMLKMPLQFYSDLV
jgi:hypothetical protein